MSSLPGHGHGPQSPREKATLDNGLSFLLGPAVQEHSFLASDFEKRPRVFPAGSNRSRAKAMALLTRASLDEMLARLESNGIGFQWSVDVNAMRYIRGTRQPPPQARAGETVRRRALWKLFDQQGCTLQVHQPQRFDEQLHQLCYALERRFGCLVGANAYLTPPKSQGLAPHFDDVEIFVCQTEGSKKWKVYAPPRGWELANFHSRDLRQDELGPMLFEVILKPGDVLYMPRGTVHQAMAQAGASTHVTISTLQRWSNLDLASATLREALSVADGMRPSLLLRRSLPFDILDGESGSKQARSLAASALRQAANELEQLNGRIAKRKARGAPSLPSWASLATEAFAADFFTSRLPPPPHLAESWPRGPRPSRMTDLLSRRGPPDLCRVVSASATSARLPEPPEEQLSVVLLHCFRNRRDTHMMGSKRRAPPIAFPASWRPALVRLLVPGDSEKQSGIAEELPVEALCQESADGPGPDEALALARALWSEGVLACRAAETSVKVRQKTRLGVLPGGKRTRGSSGSRVPTKRSRTQSKST